MNCFTYSIPTKVHFGKGQISHLAELAESGSKVLLVYGGGSIKRAGIYDKAVEILGKAGLTVYELPGVEPNPRIESVRKGTELCKTHGIQMVLAIGGGSTIDCAKVIAAAALYDGDPWDLVIDGTKVTKVLPIYAVLTLAATGSEMSKFAVISDLEKNEKWGSASELYKPKMAIMDPEYTYSVSAKQTAAGTADIMSHILENYFTRVTDGFMQARMCEALLKTIIKYGPIAMKEPDNFEARANLMWASSFAINGLLSYGAEAPWCVHPMEHELSAFYDITHGVGLAILTPFWMDFALRDTTVAKFAEFGRNVWNVTEEDDWCAAKQAIACTRDFLQNQLGLPATLGQIGIDDTHLEVMAQKASPRGPYGYVPLMPQDMLAIYRSAL